MSAPNQAVFLNADTQARMEGYFRREWNLAAGRTLDRADEQAFVVPVVIDATIDVSARVPEKFREVQWTQMPGGETPLTFAERVRRLLSGDAASLPTATPAPAPGNHASPSIAVLPFVNLSRDEENEYFADGLAEELLNVMAKIRRLRIATRSSAFAFKGKGATTIADVGRVLNVATVLEGSVIGFGYDL